MVKNHYVAMIALWPGLWTKAKTENGALKALRGHAGDEDVRKCGYLIYAVHPDTEVTALGDFLYPENHPPVLVLNRRAMKK